MAGMGGAAQAQTFNCTPGQADSVGNTFLGGVAQTGGNTNPSNLLTNLGNLGVNVTGYQVVKDEAGAAGCLTTSASDNKSGTWSSNFTVTHIAVWGGNGVGYYDVTDGGSGNWSTSCLLNNGGQQPTKSGVACFGTVTAPSNPTIEIRKVSVGGDDTFNFTTSPSLGFTSLTTAGGNATTGTISRPAGTYTVTETVPSGWELTGISCTGDTDGQSKIKKNDGKVEIDLDNGENIVCTFTNKKKGSVTIIKDAGGDTTASFGFEFVNGSKTQSFNLKGGENKIFASLKHDTYTIRENNLPAGWVLADVVCNSTNARLSGAEVKIDLAAGEDVTCTYKNRKRGSITVIKDADGDTAAKFNFSLTGQPDFELKGGENKVFPDLLPGTFKITEIGIPAGWALDQVKCTGASDFSVKDAETTINLKSGEAVTCTYKNKSRGSITVVKDAGGDTTTNFTFSFTGEPNFNLKGGQDKLFSSLKPGTYKIKEVAIPSGWKLDDLNCSGGASISISGTEATVNLAGGENVTCSFVNERQKGKLIVKKMTIGGDGSFDFTLSGQPGFTLSNGGEKVFRLDVGQYTVEEVNLPAGWILKTATCGQGTKNGNAVTVDLDANETIVCAFTNFKEKDDRMTDVTKVFINRRVDNLLSHGPDRARVLRRLDDERGESLKDGGDFEPLKITGQSEDGATDLKISGSLSSMRAAAAAAKSQRVKEQAGLEFGGTPYPYGMPTMKQRFDLWVEGQLTSYDDTTGGINREGDFKILYIGADYAITPGILLGALVQIDRTDETVDEDDLNGDVQGTGWMAGPYLGIKIRDDLFFDARAAWGRSDNDISLTDPLTGLRTGSFETDRWLASASLTGNYQFGALRVAPQVEIAYGNESSDAYKNSLGQTIDAVDITIGRLTFGPEFSYRKMTGDGTVVEPHVSIKGIWNFDSEELKLSTGIYDTEEFRAQIEGGVIVRLPEGYAVRAAGSYDGLGGGDLEAWSFKTWFNMPLN